MNIHSYIKLVMERLEEDKAVAVNREVAIAIKRKRREKNYTQEQVSKGICSISYLSKIENGHLEVDNYYVQEIINRMGLDLNDISDKDYRPEMKKLIKAMNLEEDKVILDIYNKVKDEKQKNCLRSEIIFLGKHLYFKEYEEALNLMKSINVVKNDLDNYELKIFMYFIALYEQEHMRSIISLNFVDVLSKLEIEDLELKSLIEFLKIRVYINIGNYVLAFNSINYIEYHIRNDLNINKLFRLKLLQSELLILSGHPIESERLLNMLQIDSMSKPILYYYYFINGLYLKAVDLYEEAISMFIKSSELYYSRSLINIIECYYLLGNNEMVNKYSQIYSSSEQVDKFYETLVNYFEVKTHENLYEIKDYISRYLLPLFKKQQFLYYQVIVKNDLINFHIKNGRYKEINKIRDRFDNDFLKFMC